MKAIDTIYNNLMAGKYYGYVVKNVRFPYFHLSLYKRNKFFYWSNYGSSANDANKKELTWIIEVIFKMTPEEFINKYECRTHEETLREVV